MTQTVLDLKDLLARADVTQSEFAMLVSVSKMTVNNWACGRPGRGQPSGENWTRYMAITSLMRLAVRQRLLPLQIPRATRGVDRMPELRRALNKARPARPKPVTH